MKVRKQFASTMSAKFRKLPDVSEDIEMEWSLFRSAIILSTAECCGRKRLRLAASCEKRTPWWNQDLKEAIRAKKDAYKSLLRNRSALDLQVKQSKEKSWEKFGHRLESNYKSANKVFWHRLPSAV